ncbi:MAG: type I-C CRISPR-associated protein Cas8c/Csd1 [Polyangiaceae bacterium]
MMLAALYELAQREHLVDDPDYEKKKVDFLLRIDGGGGFVALVPTRTEEGRAHEIQVPRFPKRSGTGTTPGFLFDNAKYVLGLGGEDAERNERCVEAFRGLVVDVAERTGDAGAVAVARFFERRREQLAAIREQHPDGAWTGSEWIAFVLDGDDERRVHDRPAVREHWASLRQGAGDAGNDVPVRCLVTGDMGPPARTHGNIKHVPEAQTSGAALVSFNAESFLSQGLKQGENAPISRAAAEGYVTALNWLLEGMPLRRFRQGIAVGDDAVIVFWTREACSFAETFANLLDPPIEVEAVERLVESPLKGLAPEPIDDTAFYAVTLSGNAARVVVRDWMAISVGEAKRHIRTYFDALSIDGDEGEPLGIRRLLDAIKAPSGRGLSPDLGARLLRAAIQGGPIPREILAAALRRLRLPPHKLDERRQLRARCALIKATLKRLPGGDGRKEVTVSLDERNTDVPYLLGRLFAALERLQGEAQGDLNATIRDKFFGAASSTPALVFPRLLRLSMHHAAKARGDGGRDPWSEVVKARIIEQLGAARLPQTLALDDQGLFAIGYYHQRQAFFAPRAAANAGSASGAAAASSASPAGDLSTPPAH